MNGITNYIGQVRDEFKNVTWPTRKEAVRLTLYVVSGSLLVGFFVGGVDTLLKEALKLVLIGR